LSIHSAANTQQNRARHPCKVVSAPITIDTSRVAVAVARARVMAARHPHYQLSDPAEGDLRKGFVHKRVPHVMLRSIANDEEIDSIHARHEGRLTALRARLSALAGDEYEAWEIPRDAEPDWPAEARAAHAEWRQLRRARQKEIDASIARRAESEILHDQPCEDPKRTRVSGPFTVESLSPHRALDAGAPRSERAGGGGAFVTTILENLGKAGVQNTIEDERLSFRRLDPFAGRWIHGDGAFADKGGVTRRVAVSIGPERGTVGPAQVRAAGREAQGRFDLLVICGFAFDPLAHEAAKELCAGAGRARGITVMLSRMSPDLAMGDELLEKTGAGNLFMVFGEPDVVIGKTEDGKVTVEIKGIDVYDPTTGEIRSHTTDDIACWFVDTDYDGESFFVRQAYFTGRDDPYEKLRRALKAEIDEATWASLHTTKSRPFDAPPGKRIAVKVVNHYGDEVLEVHDVS